MHNFGKDSKRGGLQSLKPRTAGTLVDYEKGVTYQRWSKWCVDINPKPYSLESLVCSAVIDFGIGAFIETQTWADMAVCGASGINR